MKQNNCANIYCLKEIIGELKSTNIDFRPLWSLTAWNKRFSSVERKKQRKIIKYKSFLAKDINRICTPCGKVKLLTTNQSDIWANEKDVFHLISEGEVVYIPGGGNPYVQYYKGKFVSADNRLATSLDKDILDNKFLYYFLQNNIKKLAVFYVGGTIKHPDMSKILEIIIPLPSIVLQHKIVMTLDKFFNLIEGIKKEIKARENQYKYYRALLLNFEINCNFLINERNIEYISIEKLFYISRGEVLSKNYIEENIGEYPVYSSQSENDGELGKINRYAYDGEYLTWTTDGVYAGSIFYRNGKFNITNVCGLLKRMNNKINIRYAYHILNMIVPNYVNRSFSNSKLMCVAMAKIMVPVPSLKLQSKIVKILDKFINLIKELKSELKMRQKQYEYYRNGLMSFLNDCDKNT